MANFNKHQLAHWMELVRTYDDGIEAFWPSQINAKAWIADSLEFNLYMPQCHSAVIFGAWYGVLADMLRIQDTICVDKEAKYLEWCAQKYDVWQGCMSKFEYEYDPDVVINTVTEHISQEVYEEWFRKIPKETFYILQGNNDTTVEDHVRPFTDLGDFIQKNACSNYVYSDSRPYEGSWNEKEDKPNYFDRYMIIGKK